MSFEIKSFIAKNGERFSQLYSSDDPWPLFYPTAFLVRSVRQSCTPSTQKVYLDAIKRLLEWAANNKIDLEVHFQRHVFLRPHEIDSLARHINAARRGKQGNTINEGKGNTYVGYVAKYLNWLANEVITDSNRPEVQDLINTQHRWLIDKLTKDGSKSAKVQKLIKKHLSEKAREQLEALWSNPFVNVVRPTDRGSRLRTVVMLRILYETGMRRGELLSLKLKHLLESTGGEGPQLVIERNHGDSFDTRINQPVAKTEGRIVPISPTLEKQLTEYIAEHRADVSGVGFDDEDFIFVTHRSKRRQGKPISISNFGQAVAGLRDLFPALDTIHAHLLRHDWNYRFSEAAAKAKVPPEKEAELRRILMGWSIESDMPGHYNHRHLQEDASRLGRKVACDTERRAPPSTEILAEARKLALVVADAK
ncbi:tyrosine-type recombinase/integrase [Duganella qianjiadongensis]|uniref:Tyrosine-type recombinase/integrase n=1 Tax=Duganella qianjiadongensis TaxID=2692176 RepID=A0ABW9VJL1_9BURK|nr:tyrosine-type recombinase/integrase [Duganella qianjiadongensis]MYM39794.1 tyrosine-type recombinase/integrase [Duganella qianjiadongensis]